MLSNPPHPPKRVTFITQTTDHGVLRFHQGYNVEELIIEYRLLRRVIIEEVESPWAGELRWMKTLP